jgi:hypothetical protein
MVKKDDEENSIASDNDTNEVEVKDDDEDDEEDDEFDEECEDKEDEDDEEEEEEEEEEDDDVNEYDDKVIMFELFKNFFVDDEGNSVATNLRAIAHELRTLNKIAKVLINDKKKSDS